MFFFWTPGIPLIVSILFALASVFVFYCFYRALRGSFWDAQLPQPGAMDRFDDDAPGHPWRCANKRCRSMNPAHARYCRLCGSARAD
ncbi:MAG: hypothetical protein DCC65_04085 [Planctomycetota bacterium]|nr:MAG: hypothetical protein DCC65_04085 [Planctomycetota bacterium]